MTQAATLAVAVAGASGRMGRMLIEAVVRADDCRLSGALDVPGSSALGHDAAGFLGADSGIRVTSELRQGIAGAQVLIDFTRPEGTMAHLAVCRELGVARRRRHHRAVGAAERRDRAHRPADTDRDGTQHERRRQRRFQAARHGRAGAERRLRHRNHRGAPPSQGRCAQRHRVADGRGGGAGTGSRPGVVRRLRPRGRHRRA